jgi:hypothetical protein
MSTRSDGRPRAWPLLARSARTTPTSPLKGEALCVRLASVACPPTRRARRVPQPGGASSSSPPSCGPPQLSTDRRTPWTASDLPIRLVTDSSILLALVSFTLSEYKYLSYNEINLRVGEVASGLRHLGIQEGARVSIYADTAYVQRLSNQVRRSRTDTAVCLRLLSLSVNWQIAAHGCTRALVPFSTAYPTLGLSGQSISQHHQGSSCAHTLSVLLCRTRSLPDRARGPGGLHQRVPPLGELLSSGGSGSRSF